MDIFFALLLYVVLAWLAWLGVKQLSGIEHAPERRPRVSIICVLVAILLWVVWFCLGLYVRPFSIIGRGSMALVCLAGLVSTIFGIIVIAPREFDWIKTIVILFSILAIPVFLVCMVVSIPFS